MVLSSIGWRKTSSTSLGNSVSSSKNNTHLCARLTSHGVRFVHHQIIEILEAV
ncbi:MAG: hypothetical protein WCG25_00430 [bacterium]